MKLTGFFVLMLCLQLSASSLAQKVTLTHSSITLKQAFKELRKQTGYYFIYNDEVMEKTHPVSVKIVNQELEPALKELLKDQPVSYSISNKVITIRLKPESTEKKALPNRTITGVVTGKDDGFPIPGVTVRVKGSTRGTVTNAAGVYKIVAPDKAVLEFVFIGYATQEVKIGSNDQINVVMTEQSKDLKEVVVAFGTSSRRDITNSVATISSKDLEQRSITNLSSAIEGAAPGIQTSSSNGQPGEGPAIRIRGFGSINGSMTPLYIVDGSPYPDELISTISADDIENISVLKDASSSALYGARAANGVILITTKKGKKDRSVIQAKILRGFTSRSITDYEKLDAYEYYPIMWEAIRNNKTTAPSDPLSTANIEATNEVKDYLGYNPFNVPDNEIVLTDGTINPAARLLYPDDMDWKDPLRNSGQRGDYSLSMSGGGTKNDYFVSLGYLDDQGFSIKSDFKRLTTRIKVNTQPRKWFNTGLNLSGSTSNSNRALDASGLNEDPFYVSLRMGPIYPVHVHNPVTGEYIYDSDGNKIYDTGNLTNLGLPLRPIFQGRNLIPETQLNEDNIKRNSLGLRPYAEISFSKDLKLTANYSYDVTNYDRLIYDNFITGDAAGSGRATRTNRIYTSQNFNQLLNYKKTIKDHTFSALLGHEFYKYQYSNNTGTKKSVITDASTEFDNFVTTTNLSSHSDTYRTEGYFSRAEYSYNGRYILSGSYRRDGSSKFSKKNRWGDFYSLGAAWNIDRESFFKFDKMNLLKLRASYGQVGNDGLNGYYLSQGLYDLGFNNGSEGGVLLYSLPNEDLEWEKNTSINAALDFGFFNNRINGTVEFFHRQSDALLFDVPQPQSSGISTIAQNIGSMRNRGVEVQLATTPVKARNFSWDINFNWTKFKNTIIKLPQEQIINDTKKLQAGHSRYDFWLYDYWGVNPETGNPLYRNPIDPATSTVTIGDEILATATTAANKTYKGSAIPDFYGTVNNTFNYKNFSFQFLVIYQVGGKVYDSDYATLMQRGASEGLALHKDILRRWQNVGDVTDVPRMTTSTSNAADNSRWLTDASYVNFRSATLSYSVPRKLISKLDIRTARLYFSGENLWMISARKGLDPSQTFTGVPSYNYPPTRIMSLGLNLSL